jgi:hypothetical protein
MLCQHLFQQTMLSQENNPEIRQHKNCQYITSSTSDGKKAQVTCVKDEIKFLYRSLAYKGILTIKILCWTE